MCWWWVMPPAWSRQHRAKASTTPWPAAAWGALAVEQALRTGDARALATARKTFMKAHGKVFFALGILQWVWYRSDRLREKFVSICRDKDVQRLTWEAYMNKELVPKRPMAHARVHQGYRPRLGFVWFVKRPRIGKPPSWISSLGKIHALRGRRER